MRYGNLAGAFDNNSGLGPWGDDFGPSLAKTVSFMSAYRTLSMAIRVRIVGLPSGQFMTPGKIYFAQIRCDHSDLPVTEQDFVTLEQLGRASHVSADAVREAGSKTIFYTPDGLNKFAMTSNFLPPAGVFANHDIELPAPGLPLTPSMGIRMFPGSAPSTPVVGAPPLPSNFTRNIIPYLARGNSHTVSATASDTQAIGLTSDSANADSTTFLFMAYFGAQDGVVLEVDYATIVEYIPSKSSPGGIEAVIQLPDSTAMDSIFSSAAVLAEARPVMIQKQGDLTISSAMGPAPHAREAASVRNRLVSMASKARGSSYREGFWDFDWLKQGSLGAPGSGASWNFSGSPAPAPSPAEPPVQAPRSRRGSSASRRPLGNRRR